MNHYLRLTVVFIVVLLFSLLTSCTQPSKPAPKPPTEPITPTPNLPVPEITVVQTLFGHKSNIGDNYSISSNGTIAIQKGLYIHLIDGYTGELKHTIAEKDDIEVFSGDIIFSPDGNLMINNHSAGASVWDINSYKLLYTLDKQISTFSDDGKLLDNTFYAETGEHLLASFDSIAYYDYITNTLKYSNLVHGPIFSPDRSIFAHIWTVQGTSTIEVRQTNDYQLLQTFPDNSIQNWESPFLEISNDNEILLTNHTSSPYSENPTAVANIWQISDAQLLDSYTRNFSNWSYLSTTTVNPKKDVFALIDVYDVEFANQKTKVKLVNLDTGEFLDTFSETHGNSIIFSPDGNSVLFRIDNNCCLQNWGVHNLDDGQLRYTINSLETAPTYFSPDGSMFTAKTLDSNVIYQLSDGKVLQRFSTEDINYTTINKTPYNDIKFMPDNKTVLTVKRKRAIAGQQYDDFFQLHRIDDGTELASFTSGANDHAKFTLSPDNQFLISFDSPPSTPVSIWDFSSGMLVKRIMNQSPVHIREAYMSPDNQTLVATRNTGGYNPVERLDVWNINENKWLFEALPISINHSFSKDSQKLYVDDHEWDVATGNKTTSAIPPHDFLYSARNSDATLLVTSGYKSSESSSDVNIWNIADGTNISTFANAEALVSPNGELLALYDYGNQNLELRQVATGQKLFTVLEGTLPDGFDWWSARWNSGFSSDSNMFFTKHSSDDNKVELWSTRTGLRIQTIQLDQESYITDTQLSPDGSFAVTISRFRLEGYNYKNEIHLWRVNDGALVKKFENLVNGYEESDYSIAFSSDGTKLIIGLGHVDYGNTITVYGTPNNDPIFLGAIQN